MLRKPNLLSAGLAILLAVSGQSIALAGGHGGGGGGGGFHSASHSVGNTMSHQSNAMRTPQLQTKQVNNVLQANKLNTVHTNTLNTTGKLTNLQTHNGLANSVQNHPIKVAPVNNSSNHTMQGMKFPGNINIGKTNTIFPIKPICPPFGGGYGKCGYGGCWGNSCGFGWGYGGWGCGNWGYGSYGNYGCGYWPGYFGGCYNYPVVQAYPVQVTTPAYVSATSTVTPDASSVALNDTAVPPLPPAPASAPASTQATVSTRDIDLAVKDVRLVEAATADRGALYRVSIINQGPANLDVPTRVAALGIKDSQPTEDTPRAIETLKSLNAGETANLDLRLPVAANALPRLLVAVEIPANFKDTNESNNIAAGEVAQVPPLAMASK